MSTPYKNLTDQGTNTNVPPAQPLVKVGIARDTVGYPGVRVNTSGSQQSDDIGWLNPWPNPGPKPMRVR